MEATISPLSFWTTFIRVGLPTFRVVLSSMARNSCRISTVAQFEFSPHDRIMLYSISVGSQLNPSSGVKVIVPFSTLHTPSPSTVMTLTPFSLQPRWTTLVESIFVVSLAVTSTL